MQLKHSSFLLYFSKIPLCKEIYVSGPPVGSARCVAKSGWINEKIFVKYLEHFFQFTKCSTKNLVLLIMDNHASHISLTASLMGRKHGIMKVTIYPHTSHKLQPLDRTVYGPFKRYYNSVLGNWMKENPVTAFFIYGIAQLAKQPFELAFTPKNILSGFPSTGIFPLNPDVFTNDDFTPSTIKDRPPLAFTTDLNSSCVELEEGSLFKKGLDNLNNACERI